MPVYIHMANLILDKKAIVQKYGGGIDQFRLDYSIEGHEVNQEDNELFSLSQMNPEDFDLEPLIKNGLDYDFENNCSEDFTILPRYDTYLWNVPWINDNTIYAWHVDASEESIKKAYEVADMKMSEIAEKFDKGENPFVTIW